MAKDLVWNNIMLAEFRKLAILTEDENKVLDCWANSYSTVKTGFKCSMADRTVARCLQTIRRKYDAVQPYSPLLPKRKQ